MKYRRYSKLSVILVFVLALSVICGVEKGGFFFSPAEATITEKDVERGAVTFDRKNPQIQAAMAVQNRHTPRLMARPEVVGTATGITDDGRPAVLVFTRTLPRTGVIPESLEGVPVVIEVTGEIVSMALLPSRVDPTARFPRPVPIGVSTGNRLECSAGTIGARVKDGGNVYALSNNHVYALENTAYIKSEVLQPGLYDTGCAYNPDNVIGTLHNYVPIDFSGNPNRVDAAIAVSTIGLLGNSTPPGGYGKPKSATVEDKVGQNVQKYGRTTALTKGLIIAINATVNVTYSSGTARFVDQIVVYSRKAFIKAGDSGSLLVTDPGRNPVGLLFAGSTNGRYAIANQIDLVLSSFGVTIDGE